MAWLTGYGYRQKVPLNAAGSIAGTIAVTNDSKNVVGTDTAFSEWLTGDQIQLPDNNWYVIESITDDTHLTITIVYPGSTASGETYDCKHINYQMKLNVHKGAGDSLLDDVYLKNHALSWTGTVPNDIRFTTADGSTELHYHIESSDANDAVVWIKFDSIGTTDTDFYIYYGKADDTTTSSGADTFIFFDDFLSWSEANWGEQPAWATLSGGICTITAEAADRFLAGLSSFGQSRRLNSLMKVGTVASGYEGGLGFFSNYTAHSRIYNNAGDNWYYSNKATGEEWVSFVLSPDTDYHHFQVQRISGAIVTFFIDATTKTSTVADDIPDGDLSVGYRCWADTGKTETLLIDWVFVSKFTDPEPTWGDWGEEEEFVTTYTKTVSMDALLKAVDSKTADLDTLIQALGIDKTVVLDVILVTAPIVTTQAVSDIAPTTATGNGTIADNGGEDASAWGVCWNTIGNPTTPISEEQVEVSMGGSTYGDGKDGQRLTISNREVTKLAFKLYKEGNPTGNVTFGIRKVSDNSVIVSKVWGSASDLDTTPTWREVVFNSPVLINEEVRIYFELEGGDSSNKLKFSLTSSDVKADEQYTYISSSEGGEWVDYSGDIAYKYSYGGSIAAGSGSGGVGAFTAAMTGLTPEIHYYVRAYATNTGGTGYGEQVEFDTLGAYTKTVSMDALLKALDSKTADLDIITVARDAKTVDIDALIRDTDIKTVDADLLLKALDYKEVNLDTLVRILGVDKTALLDTLITTTDIKEITADLLLKALDYREISLDMLVRALGIDKTVLLDTILKGAAIETVSLDILVEALGITKTVALDVILGAFYRQVDLDTLIRGTDTKTVTLDILIRALKEIKTVSIDTLIKTVGKSEPQIDALLRGIDEETLSLDILLRDTDTKQIALDILIAAIEIVKTIDLDTLIRDTDLETVDLDIWLKGLGIGETVDLDMLLRDTGIKTIDLDVWLRALDVIETIDLDTLIAQLGVTKEVAIDAILVYRNVQVVNLDAFIRTMDLRTVALDTLMSMIGIKQINLDSLLCALDSVAVALDVIIGCKLSFTDEPLRIPISRLDAARLAISRLPIYRRVRRCE